PLCLSLLATLSHPSFSFFFFTHPATTHISTLSLHDALPISRTASLAFACSNASSFFCVAARSPCSSSTLRTSVFRSAEEARCVRDRKSTRLNSSHVSISYAVFCLKKKKTYKNQNLLMTYIL